MSDSASVAAAFAAIDEGDWDTAVALAGAAGPVGRDLITWVRLREGAADFAEYPEFLTRRADWPGLDRARAAAETKIGTETPVRTVLAFFDGQPIETGEGAAAYAGALIAAGRASDAAEMLVQVWTEKALTETGFDALIGAFPDILLGHHFTRADMLLWRWRTEDAERLLPYLDEGERALVRARLGYIRKADDIDDRVALVPTRLLDHPGLAYDRFNWLADRGDWTDAVALLRDRSKGADTLGYPWRWASWRRILARWQMREGNPRVAYDLASRHFLEGGGNYADLEWLAGYLSLRQLDDPETALQHFDRFAASVTSPISLGRAGYWQGRAHDVLGNAEAADASYERAAMHPTSFYGLLATERLGRDLPAEVAGGEVFPSWQEAEFLTTDRMQAALMLLAANERGLAVLFIADLAKDLTRTELGQLGQLLLELDEPFLAILVAKTGVRRDLLVQDIYFPVHPLADMDLPVAPELALAIARQESEFRPDAGSAVGALGLMQLMPGTARDMAAETGEPFSRARLTSDWAYNARLGAAYLAYLREDFGESPVLIAVGYNAGPGRVRDWLSERGDPRRGETDVIDWIEHIPFRETRNYVMRVTEAIPVYRARLDGETGPVAFSAMLRGSPPVIRPRLRPEGLGQDRDTDQAAPPESPAQTRPPVRRGGQLEPQTPAGPQPVRPIARPGGG